MEKTSSPTQAQTERQHSSVPGIRPSNFNLPQRFTWLFGYKVPNSGGSMQRLKNGWGFDSTVTLQSGQPFQMNYNFEDDFSGSGEGMTVRTWWDR